MKKTEIVVAVVLVVASVFTAGVVEAKRGPSAITVCVNSTGVVSRVAANATCVGESQKWSASKLAPQLCWDASSVDPKSRTRLVSLAPTSGCVAPLKYVPVNKVVLLCADQLSGVLRWSVTNACETGNANTWVRVGALRNAAPASATTTTTTVALVPSVSLQTTLIQGNTWPKAVTVTANVAGTIYFVEGSVSVKSVKDITNAHPLLWAQGAVIAANTATSITLNVENLVNGYYRVFVVTAQGALSAPAGNIVTISVTRAGQATTTTSTTSTTVAVRVQTLDQSAATWHTGGYYYGVDPTQSMGQCFTAGLTGPLSRISVGMTRSGYDGQITAEIFAADGSCYPTGSALATNSITDGSTLESTLPSVSGGALTDFAFTTPVSVTATMKYAIVITTTGNYRWYRFEGDSYAGGRGIYLSDTSTLYPDLMFQTYVDI